MAIHVQTGNANPHRDVTTQTLSHEIFATGNRFTRWLAFLFFLNGLFASFAALSQSNTLAASTADPTQERLKALEESLSFVEQRLVKSVNDVMWFHCLEDVARVDKIRYTGPASRNTNSPAPQGAGNEVIISAYTFLPKKSSSSKKIPLMVLVHGEVHGDTNPHEQAHIVRELLEQGYAVIAPDYRGSTGYGRDFWRMIDYGGLENEDVFAGKTWMLEHHLNIDPKRVGIMGWSHGGLITLMNIFHHPQDYTVAYAGMPVCDLVARLEYMGVGYREIFSAPHHIGKIVAEDLEEYRRRSPVANAEKLQTPLLLHAVTNDEDVKFVEIENMLAALKTAGKSFEHRIYTNAPGGHAFNQLDTRTAQESRREVYRFLAKYLQPPHPWK